ncbi:hypothetical protein EGJ52_08675 [Pseudomonas luteola]|nr:hypothetical protein EGJ52_08675 [Pseudomonas luteola]
MRITLNDRTVKEVVELMELLNTSSPTHAVQVAITKLKESLIPNSEDNHGNCKKQDVRAL